jgi:RHS repeat-associated protein
VLTDKLFTGQQEEYGEPEFGLYYYGARFYSTKLGRFLSPDPLVVSPGDPQALDRYAYVRNNLWGANTMSELACVKQPPIHTCGGDHHQPVE